MIWWQTRCSPLPSEQTEPAVPGKRARLPWNTPQNRNNNWHAWCTNTGLLHLSSEFVLVSMWHQTGFCRSEILIRPKNWLIVLNLDYILNPLVFPFCSQGVMFGHSAQMFAATTNWPAQAVWPSLAGKLCDYLQLWRHLFGFWVACRSHFNCAVEKGRGWRWAKLTCTKTQITKNTDERKV